MPEAPLEFLTVNAANEHTATVIFLHGLGGTGSGWEPAVVLLSKDPALAHVKWVLPHSPSRSVTANMGSVMPAWFDMHSLDSDNAEEDEQGMLHSVGLITALITEEIEKTGMDPSRIILGGFSQGGTMTLLTGLTGKYALAGIVALSGRLPLRDHFNEMAVQKNLSTPIFWGRDDTLVTVEFAQSCVDHLVNVVGLSLTKAEKIGGLSYHVYDGLAHSVSDVELEDVKRFIIATIPSN